MAQLVEQHGHHLWAPGKHKTNVFSFILEANEILLSRQLPSFELPDLEEIQEAWRQHGNSVATINRKTMALSKLLRAAHKAGAVSAIPEFRQLEEPPERIRFLTIREENSLFGHIRSLSKDYYDLSIVLVDTGAKIGEIIDLRWADISHDASTLRLSRNKGRYDRTIPTTARVAAILAPMQRTSQEGPFCTIEQYKYRAVWNEAKVRAGLGNDEGIVPYVLRHTCASRLVQGGVDLRRVQLWLGHRTLQMTMKYDYLSTNNLNICASVLHAMRG
ncbi:site-specific integrase [Mesorhizobium sp. ESP7-2]|uniref:tyrosine-type recombinase/integrase n=1 Tax=Mesorhizobium sp. ESP7-2 TaxID=2876622 RepID=UPI001CCDEA0C|nr:site-specific integrase [Mesorhizobium sp. ESP7-2]MBZ9710352.1 site-specific integrase [Mesorhizobium sp. ESP7-2]